jgi:hypothetical protein
MVRIYSVVERAERYIPPLIMIRTIEKVRVTIVFKPFQTKKNHVTFTIFILPF